MPKRPEALPGFNTIDAAGIRNSGKVTVPGGGATRAMEAGVLAGGRGTRLRKVVPGLSKSLAPTGTRPFLSYLLGWLRSQGITGVILAMGNRRAAHPPGSLRLRYSVESAPLGTGGALRNLRSLLAGKEFLVLNGDSIFDVDLRRTLSFHRRHRSDATLALACPPQTSRYGSVVLDSR